MKYRLGMVGVLAIVVAVLLILNARKGATVSGSDSAFHNLTLAKALAQAKQDSKPVFIDFTAEWCGPCRQLDSSTFSNGRVRRLLRDKTIAIKVDIDQSPGLAQQFRVRSIPCMVILDAEGNEIGRIVGYRDAGKFSSELSRYVQ